MTVQLLIANKRSGMVWDVSDCAQSITYTTNRTGSPGTLKFTVIKSGDLDYLEGDVVRFSVDGTLGFYGWGFTKSKNRWGEIETTCYDRLRYFKQNASYAFYAQKAGDIIRQIAADLQIDVGTLDDTGYAIPSLIEEDQSCLDIVESALQQTLLNTSRVYVFFDDGNGVCLRESGNMISPVVIGDRSLMTDYTY